MEGWIKSLTKPGDLVLDPFCGRGTTVFQALLMNRNAIGCDKNPVAYCITRAKTNAPKYDSLKRRLRKLERNFDENEWKASRRRLPKFFRYAYRPETLQQILYLRSCLRWQKVNTDCMLAALILGALHGESNKSKSYLSNQMPRTISTKPVYSVGFWNKNGFKAPKRDVFDLLRDRIEFRYVSEPPIRHALVYNKDIRMLPRFKKKVKREIKCIITSPPYLDVTNFEEDQWLRLWFLGGPPKPTYNRISKDDRHTSQTKYWNFISDMWGSFGEMLGTNADVVIRLGGKNITPEEILNKLLETSKFSKRAVKLKHHEVSEIKGRQTNSFSPGTKGCAVEIDCYFRMS